MQYLKGIRKLFICCSIPEPKASLIFELSNLRWIFKNGYIIKCVIKIKQWVQWVQSPDNMGGYTL